MYPKLMPGPGPVLLYVEDEEITRETVCTLLQRRFPDLLIHTARNGAEGLQLFRELCPDLVMTDIKMPVMNGIEMARHITELKANVPIVVTTAHSDMAYLIECIEIGISRYLMKPIDSGKLFAAIAGCLATIQLERELQAQQDHIRKLSRAVEQSPSSIVIVDPMGVIEYVNPKFTALTGYSEQEVLGRNLRSLQEMGDDLWATLLSGSEWQGELEGVKKSGEPYSESTSISPIFDINGGITHLVVVKEDITQRRQNARDIELLNRTLSARAHELEVANRDLEAFSYTVSHDLRTPLTNINGYCQVIIELFGQKLDPQCKEFIDIIFNETITMSELIRTLLEFSRLTRTEMFRSRTDLSELAVEIAAGFRMRHPQRRVEFEILPGMAAEGDPDLLRLLLDNLLGNAFKYTSLKEEALIQFEVIDRDGESVYLVRDDGAGFDMAKAGKLFTPFQRLHPKAEFSGFGIGLATVQRIVQRHGGRVWAEAKPEQGATFYFTLPQQQL